MKKLFLILIMIMISATAYADKQLVRITHLDSEHIRQLAERGFDIAGVRPGEYCDIVVNDAEYDILAHEGYQLETRFTQQERTPLIPSEYITYPEMITMLEDWEDDYPAIAKIYDIGDSWEKAEGGEGYIPKDIWAMKVSAVVEEEENEPSILICGEHHSREPPTVNITMGVIEHLLTNYDSDPDIQYLVDNLEIWFVPIVNPDGYRIVYDNIDTWWRKNTHDNNGNGQFDGYGDGVDPNRNYSVHWEDADDDPGSETYHGEYPFSEPEIQAVRDLILEQHSTIVHTYHTHGELILYPWGHTYDSCPDNALVQQMAEDMAVFNGYDPIQSSDLYPTGGEMCDWSYATLGAPSFTSECATEFIPPGSMVQQLVDENVPTDIYLMERALEGKVCGNITDAETGDPLEAVYNIEEIPWHEDFEERKAEPLHGRFDRLLLPGEYTLTVSHIGYYTEAFDVTITNEEDVVELDIQLQPEPQTSVQGTVSNTDGNPIPNATIDLAHDLFQYDSVETDEDGNFMLENIFADYEYQIVVMAPDYDSAEETIYVAADSVYAIDFVLAPVQSFELSDAGFTGEGEWEWGLPQESGGPATAYAGENAWGTDLDDEYDGGSNYDLLTTPWILSDNETPAVGFYTWYDIADGWDGGNFQISIDDGENWDLLIPEETYPDNSIVALTGDPGFTGESDNWEHYSFDLNGYQGETVMFRFHFAATNSSEKGWFVDNFAIYGATPLAPSPQNLMATVTTDPSEDPPWTITLTWQAPETDQNVAQYNIYRREDGEPYDVPYATVSGETLQYIDAENIDGDPLYYVVSAVYDSHESNFSNEVAVLDYPSHIDSDKWSNAPSHYALEQNYPNPFNPNTTITYQVPQASYVNLSIYDVSGKLIKTIVDGETSPGNYSVNWNGKDDNGDAVSSGIYLYRLHTDKAIISTQRMILLR